jgi:site-specific DNA-methyltransferase (adenine-specific)
VIELPTDAEPVRIVEGDALAVLRTLPDGCVDAVATDPPYGQSNEKYDGRKVISLRSEVWEQCARVCKPNAALVSFAGSPTYHRIAAAIEDGGWGVRQMWGWVYRDGMISSAYPREGFDRLAPAMDPIVFATRGKVLLNVDREGKGWKINRPRSKASPMSERFRSPETASANGRYPKSIVSDGSSSQFEYFASSRTSSRRGDRTPHPNQKPIGLMRWLIAKLPAMVILDPFGGSGTTGVAALAEGRRCILIEKDPAYAAIARGRVAEAMGTGLLAGIA